MMKVLLVDDDAVIRKSVRAALQERLHGVWVSEVSRVSEAVSAIRDFSPDLVIMEVNLPDKCGLTLAASLHIHCPVIMASESNQFAAAAFDSGAIDYLVKPFSQARLLRATKKALSRAVRAQLHQLSARVCPIKAGIFFNDVTGKVQTATCDVISHITDMGGDVRIHLTDGTIHQHLGDLASLWEQLEEPHFRLMNRNLIINHRCVVEVSRHTDNQCQMILSNGDAIHCAGRRDEHLHRMFN